MRVSNEGKAPSGEVVIGVVCADETVGGCSEPLSLESMIPGTGAEGVLEVVAPQGESVARAFAGGDDDGYRWGADNVETLIIDVPSKPATELTLSAEFEVKGYWPDGTADVELAVTLLNEGYSRLEGAQRASFTCRQEDEAVSGCDGEVEASLPDGFESAPQKITVRVPMGGLQFDFDLGGEEPTALAFDVPRRIVGVSREIWECFSDRPGIWEDDPGCGGWYSDTVVKWPQDKPVTVWVTGEDDYIRVFEETLEELSPLLDLDFEWTEDEDEADLRAYMGVPRFRAGGTPVDCTEALGCANWDHDDGVARDAVVSVWPNNREWRRELGVLQGDIRRTTLHEVLHAMVPVHHRTDPTSIVNTTNALRLPRLSRMDEALIRLHSHPLVEPGMAMDEIEALIVFEDELLEAPPPEEPDGYELAWRAFAALQTANSAGFDVAAQWYGRGCDNAFGASAPARYEFADFGVTHHFLIYLKDGTDQYFVIDSRDPDKEVEHWKKYVRDGVGTWREVDVDEFYEDNAWRATRSSPHRMLASILHFAGADDVEVSRETPGRITLKARLDKPFVSVPWTNREDLDVVISLRDETYEIEEYSMDWKLHAKGASCPGYKIEATSGTYGIEIQIPDAIREASNNLP